MIRWCSSIWSLCIWPARFCQHLQYAAIQEAQRMLGRCFTSSGATNGPCRMSLVHLKGEDFEDFTPLWAWTSRFGMMLSLCFWSGYVRGCFLLCFVCEALFPKSVVNCFSVICLSSYPTISLVHWLTDSLPATLPSLFQAFQVELQGFEKEWHLEISEGKNGLGPTWSLPSQAAAKESTASSQMQMALQLWKSLRSVFFFFGKTTEKLSCVARFETWASYPSPGSMASWKRYHATGAGLISFGGLGKVKSCCAFVIAASCSCWELSSCHSSPCTSNKQIPCTAASFSLGFRKLCHHGLLISAKKAAQEPSQQSRSESWNLSNLQLPMLAGMVPKSPPMTQGPPSNVAVVGMLELLKGLGGVASICMIHGNHSKHR